MFPSNNSLIWTSRQLVTDHTTSIDSKYIESLGSIESGWNCRIHQADYLKKRQSSAVRVLVQKSTEE